MTAIDTNVLVRFLTADDPRQYQASRKLMADAQVFIANSVILETEWVLRAAYGLAPAEVCHALRAVVGLTQVTSESPERVIQALDWHAQGLDFADAFHLASSQHQPAFKTFDGALIKHAKGLSTCAVGLP